VLPTDGLAYQLLQEYLKVLLVVSWQS